jgi:glycosyltransferase involved in cell wall biosynthesis
VTAGRPAVLLVGDTLNLGGTEGQLVELACRLDRSRWDVEVACVRPEGPLRPRLEGAGFEPWHCGPASFKSPRLLGAIEALARRIRTRGIALVHSFDFYTNMISLPAARLAGVRAIIGSQRNLGNLRPSAQQMMHNLSLRLATHVLVNSDAVKERVVQSQGIRPERVTVIPNGVDLARFSPRHGRPRNGSGLVVGALSNLRPEKGLADLVQAVGMVRDQCAEVRLVIWGEGPLRSELEGLVAALNLAASVALPGSTGVPEAALRDLDIFVLPSLSEASSNGLMEAMATALPVVATSVGGNPGLVEDEITGLLVPPKDASALAKAIIRLVEDRALAAQLGEQARAHAELTFGMERMVARTEALYARALDERAAR